MQVVRTIDELADFYGGSFVPTMGALHEGHLSLIRQAKDLGSPVVVSIFVNPTQFSPDEDFSRYPRQLDEDIALAEGAGAEAIFAPEVDTIYPPPTHQEQASVPNLPSVATEPGLEDAKRPTHFAGVCQVVARLFDLVNPHQAIFGEKDYQQLSVIRAMVEQEDDRWPNLTIVPGPTVREPDGLAMSSRNVYLDPQQRKDALGLSSALLNAQSALSPGDAEATMHSILQDHHLEVEYAVVRDAKTLLPIENYSQPARALIAARVGTVRLIDNMPM